MKRVVTVAAAIVASTLAAACGSANAAGDGPSANASTTHSPDAPTSCAQVDLGKPPAQPVALRFAHGTAAEEQIYLMQASAKTTPYAGKWYTPTYSTITNSSDRLTALRAGQIDGASLSTQPIIHAVGKDVKISIVADEANEDKSDGFTSKFAALKSSGITSIADLKGKTIGIPDYGTAIDFWARSAVAKAGLDPQRDVKYALVPLASEFDALKNGTIDVASLVEPFYTMAKSESSDLVDVFDSITGSGISPQPLQNAVFSDKFIKANVGAVCAWLSDFNTSTKYYLDHTKEAKQELIDAKIVKVPAAVYLKASDWARPANGELNLSSLNALIAAMKKLGIIDKTLKVTAEDMVYPGVSQTTG